MSAISLQKSAPPYEPLEYKEETRADAATISIASALLQKSPSLEKQLSSSQILNLKLANTIIGFVKEKVPIITNNLGQCEIAAKDLPLGFDSIWGTLDFDNILGNLYEMAFSNCEFETYSKKAMQMIAEAAQNAGLGTCLELAAVGFNYCLENSVSQKIEVFYIDGGNHVFLVIGRDPKSKPEDFKNWGPHAVVCDPWSKKAYPASKIEKELNSFVSQKFEKGKYTALLSPFDPKSQKLTLLF